MILIYSLLYSVANLIGFSACLGIAYVLGKAVLHGDKQLLTSILGFMLLSIAFLLESIQFFLASYAFLSNISPFLEPFAPKYRPFWIGSLISYLLGYLLILTGYIIAYKEASSGLVSFLIIPQAIIGLLPLIISFLLAKKFNAPRIVILAFLMLALSHFVFTVYLMNPYGIELLVLALTRFLAAFLLMGIFWRL